MSKTTRNDLLAAALQVLALAAAFGLGALTRHGFARREAAPRAGGYLEQAARLNTLQAGAWDEYRDRVPEEERPAARAAWRAACEVAARDCRLRHGMPEPPAGD